MKGRYSMPAFNDIGSLLKHAVKQMGVVNGEWDVFDDDFMSSIQISESFVDFLKRGGFDIDSFAKDDTSDLNAYISQNTPFESFRELKLAAIKRRADKSGIKVEI